MELKAAELMPGIDTVMSPIFHRYWYILYTECEIHAINRIRICLRKMATWWFRLSSIGRCGQMVIRDEQLCIQHFFSSFLLIYSFLSFSLISCFFFVYIFLVLPSKDTNSNNEDYVYKVIWYLCVREKKCVWLCLCVHSSEKFLPKVVPG